MLTVWGIGGLSAEIEKYGKRYLGLKSVPDYLGGEFITNMGATGMTHTAQVGDEAFIKTSIALMGQDVLFTDDTFQKMSLERGLSYNTERYKEGRAVISSYFNQKINSRLPCASAVLPTVYDLNRETYRMDRYRCTRRHATLAGLRSDAHKSHRSTHPEQLAHDAPGPEPTTKFRAALQRPLSND